MRLMNAKSRHRLDRILHHLYSIWLFTRSDIKTIILPSLSLAILTACASPTIGIRPTPQRNEVIRRLPLALLWLWTNLLPFNIDNQRSPEAIREDSINKPWRTLPSKRMRPDQATTLMLYLYPLSWLVSLQIGGTKQSVALVVLGIWYNDLHGSDSSFVVRNLINACGFVSFASAAGEVLLGPDVQATGRLYPWLLVFGGVVFSTVQIQDMHDQIGDALRQRRTLPLVVGDSRARWLTAGAMAVWCVFCPWFWRAPVVGYAVCIILGGVIVARLLMKRTIPADEATFKLWNLWLVVLHCLPLITQLAA